MRIMYVVPLIYKVHYINFLARHLTGRLTSNLSSLLRTSMRTLWTTPMTLDTFSK